MTLSKIKTGMLVRYHPVIGGPHDGNAYRVRTCGRICGQDVVKIEGKVGCVSVKAISPLEPGPERPKAA